MKRQILCCLIFLLFEGICNANEKNDLEKFIQLLSKDVSPTLADYYYFYGHGAEEELQLSLEFCKKEGWVPANTHDKCLNYIKSRQQNPDRTPSLYLAWLRGKLPISPKLTIQKIEHLENKDFLDHELIYASLNNMNVVFYKTMNSRDFEQFGRIGVSEINGISIRNIFENDFFKID